MRVKLFEVSNAEETEKAINKFLTSGVRVHSVRQTTAGTRTLISIFYEVSEERRERPTGVGSIE